MSKILFSPKQVQQLQNNPNVQQVSERTITYTDAFKSQFIDEYSALEVILFSFFVQRRNKRRKQRFFKG